MHMQLEFLREMKYSWEECAAVLMVSRSTLWRHAQELGTSHAAFSNISDTELDSVVERIAHQAPSCGVIMVWGQLRSYGVNVPRRRVRESLLRVSPRGVQQRRTTTIHAVLTVSLHLMHCGTLMVSTLLYGGEL